VAGIMSRSWNSLEMLDADFFEDSIDNIIIKLSKLKEKYKGKKIEIMDFGCYEKVYELIEIVKNGEYSTGG
jgi:hypothetical protein